MFNCSIINFEFFQILGWIYLEKYRFRTQIFIDLNFIGFRSLKAPASFELESRRTNFLAGDCFTRNWWFPVQLPSWVKFAVGFGPSVVLVWRQR